MKIDFKKTLPSYKARRGVFEVVDVPAMQYLMVDGGGGPEAESFKRAIETVYPVAYTLKFMSKNDLGKDYVVPPMEALWWAEDWSVFTTGYDRSRWEWSVMLMTPDWITREMFDAAVEKVAAKKNRPPGLDELRLGTLAEGRCVQTLHLGPFADEGPVLKRMHEQFIPEQGLKMTGKHHEIYFSDFRKTAPEKLRTLLRQPVA
ncbi:GyrI-like domain-containing protein [Algisphaera agarilytica]|uniref:GyrI-like small molecule binding domain-containing protein n=1 Tax=Algisphaera agarilytica TaxID=1385975 RepID=A0A7X0LMF5_9BACT|nr:GyrI-like domain-containing protein [Algisphaera agarilytica]MBB6431581.1 hypothetical protein [Algisphaera agarilytica]